MTHAISCDSLITWQNAAKVTLCLGGIALIAWGGTNYSQLKGIISMSAGGTVILGTAIYQVVDCLKSPRYKDPNLYDHAGRPFPPEYLARPARPPKEPYEVKEALVPEQPSAAAIPQGLTRRRVVYQRISHESHLQNKQGVSRIHIGVIRTHLLGCLSLPEIDSLSRTCRHLFESVYGTCDLDKHLESHRTFDRHFARVVSILLHKMPSFADLTSRLPLLNRIEFSGEDLRRLSPLLSHENNQVKLPKLEGVKTLTFNHYQTRSYSEVDSSVTTLLKCCPNVTSLNFDHCQFHERENLKRWVLTFKETLTQLSLTHASSAEVISDAIASFGACQQLQVFVLSHFAGNIGGLNQHEFDAFARGCTELTHLDLSHNTLIDRSTIVTIFRNFPKLTALNLSSTNPRFIMAPEILEKLDGKNLEELHMSRSWIDHHSMQHFNSGRVYCFNNVTRLYLGECELLTMDDFQWVVKYINTGMSKHPTHLSLPGANMTDDMFKKLMRSKEPAYGSPSFCRDLEELTLHNCRQLTIDGISKGLGECQKLKKAEIRGTRNITPQVIEEIADISVEVWFAKKEQLLTSGRPFAQMESIIIANTGISGREKTHEIGRPIRIICAMKAAMKCMRRSDSKGLGIKIVRSSPHLTHLIKVDSDSLPKRLEEELAAFKKQDPVFNTSWD